MKRTRQELGSFCQQFNLSVQKSICNGNYLESKPYSKPNKPSYKRSTHRKRFYSKLEQPYCKKKKKTHKPSQSKPKPKLDLKNITCYKYGKKGHTSRFCKVNTKLYELQIDEEIINQI
jgi:hypothetical protein